MSGYRHTIHKIVVMYFFFFWRYGYIKCHKRITKTENIIKINAKDNLEN